MKTKTIYLSPQTKQFEVKAEISFSASTEQQYDSGPSAEGMSYDGDEFEW